MTLANLNLVPVGSIPKRMCRTNIEIPMARRKIFTLYTINSDTKKKLRIVHDGPFGYRDKETRLNTLS